MQTVKDATGNIITLERLDVFRLLHEILVNHLGDRNNKDRNKHDGLTSEHQELKKNLGVLLKLAILYGKSCLFSNLIKDTTLLYQNQIQNMEFTQSIFDKQIHEIEKKLVQAWIKIE
jgi:hypothetical protein